MFLLEIQSSCTVGTLGLASGWALLWGRGHCDTYVFDAALLIRFQLNVFYHLITQIVAFYCCVLLARVF